MPLSLKKKPDATAPALPAWHPNFANPDKLPDTKVVRTAFFINGGALAAVLALAIWFGYQEYQLFDLDRQIDEWNAQIDRDRPVSGRLVAQFKKYQAEAARISEIEAFLGAKPVFSELLLHLAETLPANIALDAVDFRDAVVTVRGTVRGAPDFASGYASNYVGQLKEDAALKERFADVTLVSLNRNPQTGRLSLEITLRVLEPKKS